MKYFSSIGFLLTIFVTLSGCLTDKGELVEDAPLGFCDSVGVTYLDTMKVLIDNNCAFIGCHSTGFGNGDFTSYASMQGYGALEQSLISNRVSATDASLVMPLGNPLPDSVKVLFQCWADAGFPQE